MTTRYEGDQFLKNEREVLLARAPLTAAFLDPLFETDFSRWSEAMGKRLEQVIAQMKKNLGKGITSYGWPTLGMMTDTFDLFGDMVELPARKTIVLLLTAIGYELGALDKLLFFDEEIGDRLVGLGFYRYLSAPRRMAFDKESATRLTAGMLLIGVCWRIKSGQPDSDDQPQTDHRSDPFNEFIADDLDLSGL